MTKYKRSYILTDIPGIKLSGIFQTLILEKLGLGEVLTRLPTRYIKGSTNRTLRIFVLEVNIFGIWVLEKRSTIFGMSSLLQFPLPNFFFAY